MDRLGEICSLLRGGRVLADVGCDHGYCASYALKSGLYEKVYISDISAGSLKKAETLLEAEIAAGKCIPVLADGMHGLGKDVDSLLIAGLGGEEIVRILREGFLPENFVLQPMKNAEKVREYLIGREAKIERDYTFFADGYYYDVLVGKNSGGSLYSIREIEFGKENLLLRGDAFLAKLRAECAKIEGYLGRGDMSERNREKLKAKLALYEEILNETHRSI